MIYEAILIQARDGNKICKIFSGCLFVSLICNSSSLTLQLLTDKNHATNKGKTAGGRQNEGNRVNKVGLIC